MQFFTRLPSIKTLTPVFGDRAKEARELLEGKRKTRGYESVRDWECQCCNRPSYQERLMCALAEIGEFCGVEYLSNNRTDIAYLNAGDTYAPTLLIVNGVVRVGCLADVLERVHIYGKF